MMAALRHNDAEMSAIMTEGGERESERVTVGLARSETERRKFSVRFGDTTAKFSQMHMHNADGMW